MSQKAVKTRKFGFTRVFFRTFVDIKRWLNYDEVKGGLKTTVDLFNKFFSSRREPACRETYEESIARLNLNEMQLLNRKKVLLYSSLIYFFVAIVFFLYSCHQLISKHLFSGFMGLILVFFLAILAYREHFWYMQIRKKKLGCSFYDWLDFISRGAK